MFAPARRALAFAFLLLPLLPRSAAAQEEEEEEVAGGSRGGYAWGEGTTDTPSGPAAPPAHRYARIFGAIGAGLTVRILEYHVDVLDQQRLAPPYLQLRGGYFFEGDGDFQHGVGLGIATPMNGDGLPDRDGVVYGVDPFASWTFTPQYLLRIWFDDWIQLLGRVGVSVTAAAAFNWGFEVGLGPVIKFLAGLGLYAEASFSTFFGTEYHPLVSVEGGLVIDLELLP